MRSAHVPNVFGPLEKTWPELPSLAWSCACLGNETRGAFDLPFDCQSARRTILGLAHRWPRGDLSVHAAALPGTQV